MKRQYLWFNSYKLNLITNRNFYCLLVLLLACFSIFILANTWLNTAVKANNSQPVLQLTNSQGKYNLSPYLDILEDKDKSLTIDDITSEKFDSKFKHNQQSIPTLGFKKSAFWLRLKIENKSSLEKTWLLEIDFPRLNQVDLYLPVKTTSEKLVFTHKTIGSSFAFAEREVKHQNLVFKLPVPQQEQIIIYLRVESSSTKVIPLTLWQTEYFTENNLRSLLLFGIYYGIFLGLIIYHIFLYITIRDPIYFFYVMRISTVVIVQLTFDGLAAQYLWPNSASLTNHIIQISVGLIGVWAVFVGRNYLCLSENLPSFDKPTKFLAVWFAFLTLVSLFFYHPLIPFINNLSSIILLSVLIFTTVLCIKKNFNPAWYYLISLSTFGLSGIAMALRNSGIIVDTFFAHYIFHFGTAAEVVLLSLGLAARIRILQKAKEQAETNARLKEKDAEIFSLRNVELTQANARLKELDQVKSTFTAMLVHDLKSPLSVVKATLEILSEDETVDKENKSLIVASERSVNKILTLVREVLELYRSDSQDIKLDFQEIEAQDLLYDCFQAARLSATPSKIQVELDIKEALPKIIVDIVKLERVLANLLSNAIKFTPERGKITIEACLITKESEIFLQISIKDTGEGISTEAIPSLFEPYRQAESRKKGSGVGLGLAIVKRIITAHNGTISINSQLGVGSTFIVQIPIMPKEKSDISGSLLEKPLEKSFSPSQIRPKISISPIEETRIYTINQPQTEPKPEVLILLVEDEKMNQLIVKRQLQQLGYKLDIAENGLEALKMLSKKAYQVIFMDCNMPVMDGYKATVEIRRLESEHNKINDIKKHTPIIALTASDAQYPEKFFQAGMDDFLEKPFQINQFIAILEKWLSPKTSIKS